MLAEFNALRTEIIARSNAQSALVGVGLTAIGVVMGFVFKDDGRRQLLLAVFGLASLFSVLLARDAHVGLVVLGWACTVVSIGTPILLLVLDRIRGTSTWLYGDQES